MVRKFSTLLVDTMIYLYTKNHNFIFILSGLNWSPILKEIQMSTAELYLLNSILNIYLFGENYVSSTRPIIMKFLRFMVHIMISS
jgi:hypothetical protein